jgi:hypothetical protein
MKIWATLAFISTFSVVGVNAQENNEVEGEWFFNAHVGTMSLDKDKANSQYSDSSAYVVGFNADYLTSNWITTGTVAFLVYDDYAEFSQVVEGQGWFNNGDSSVESSNASGVIFSIASGYQWTVGEEREFAARLQAGFSGLTASERGIENCSNCYSEDININGGLFLLGSIQRDVGRFSIGLFYQQYFSGDLNNSLGISISSGF